MRAEGFLRFTARAALSETFFQRDLSVALQILVRQEQQRGFVQRIAFNIVVLCDHFRRIWVTQGAKPCRSENCVIRFGTCDIMQHTCEKKQIAVNRHSGRFCPVCQPQSFFRDRSAVGDNPLRRSRRTQQCKTDFLREFRVRHPADFGSGQRFPIPFQD